MISYIAIILAISSCVYGDSDKNVLGGTLETCSTDPMTGWYRDGKCQSGKDDYGTHVVCAKVTKAFLVHSKAVGNDLSTPHGSSFPGLKPGDHWCLCAIRWHAAMEKGLAPPVVLEATNIEALNGYKISLDDLKNNEASKEKRDVSYFEDEEFYRMFEDKK